MNGTLTKMRTHFEGDNTKAYLALALLAAGILINIPEAYAVSIVRSMAS